jgi:hypothetical protein
VQRVNFIFNQSCQSIMALSAATTGKKKKPTQREIAAAASAAARDEAAAGPQVIPCPTGALSNTFKAVINSQANLVVARRKDHAPLTGHARRVPCRQLSTATQLRCTELLINARCCRVQA